MIYTVFKEYDCYRVVYDPISQRDIGDCAIIKTFYSRPIHDESRMSNMALSQKNIFRSQKNACM